MDDGLVWYAAYGSNLLRERFLCYLQGGRASGASIAQRGARDPVDPVDDRAVTIDREMFFAEVSRSFGGGGVAFVDHVRTAGTATLARAYLITHGQLEDVVAQESRRDTTPIDVSAVGRGVTRLGAGRYDTLAHCGELEGRPLVTCTSAGPLAESEPQAPGAVYLQLVARGLRQAHRLDVAATVDYLLARPAVATTWTRQTLGAQIRAHD